MAFARRLALGGAALLIAGACGGDDSGSSTAGVEGGSCYPNRTCNTGLTCASNLCVRVGGACTPGASAACACPNGSSGTQTCDANGTTLGPCQCEGSPTTGGAAGVAGSPITGGAGGIVNTGGAPQAGAGGTPPTGGAAGSGGAAGTGGAAPCSDTSTDRLNCGACGRVCRSEDADACIAGQCEPAWGGCFRQLQFANCDLYCASIGETCAQDSCRYGNVTTFTARRWSGGDEYGCIANDFALNDYAGPNSCSRLFDREPDSWYNCCCTDTQ